MELRESSYDKDKHLYGGEEVGDIIVGKLPDEEFLDEENELAKAKKLLPGELTRQKKSSLRIVSMNITLSIFAWFKARSILPWFHDFKKKFRWL